MAYIAKTNGERTTIKTPVSLKQAQDAVGGYVQRFFTAKGLPVLCNEDGFSKQLPLNIHGTELIGNLQPIVGNIVVFVTRKEAKGWIR